jgi:RNA polymerase sigma factor (sigma-70 family)
MPARAVTRTLGALSDRRLAELASDGDGEQSFAAIYARYHQPLYRYCHSIVRDPDDAADALQSAMLKAYLALPVKKAEVALKPWLYRIVHNEAISVIRRRARHDEITEANSPRAPSAHDDMASRARLAELVDDLQQLEERQRAALVMRELSGLEYEEIAAAFGTSAAGAKQAVYEARVALHERAEGRAMSCEPIRRAVSDGDRRTLRGRKLRAHLRACAGCRDFERAMGGRRADLAALAPPLPAPAAAALLKAIIGGGAAGSGDGALGASLGAAAANVAALKALTAAVTVAAGAGAIGMSVSHDSSALRSATAPTPHTVIAAARRAPPLTSLYVLSAGRVPVTRLRAPEQLLADAPRGGSRYDGLAGSNGAASGPLGLSDAPLTISQGGDGPPAAGSPQASPDAHGAPAVPGVGMPQLPHVPPVRAPQLPATPVTTAPAAPSVPAVPDVPSTGIPAVPGVRVPQAPSLPSNAPSLPLP